MLIVSDSPAVGLSSDMPDIRHVPRYERPTARPATPSDQHDDDISFARRRRRRKRKAKFPGASSANDRATIQWWLQRSFLSLKFAAPETEQAFLFYLYQGHMYLIAALLVLVSLCTTVMILAYPTARNNPHTSALLVHLTVTAICSLGFGIACVAWVRKFMKQADDQVSEALAAHQEQSHQEGNPLIVGNTRVMHIPAAGLDGSPQNLDNQEAEVELARRQKAVHDAATRQARQKQHPFGGSHRSGMGKRHRLNEDPNAQYMAAPIYAVLTQQSSVKAVQVRAFEIFATLLGLVFASLCSFQFYEMALCEALLTPDAMFQATTDMINPCSTFIPTVDLISQITLVVILSPRALLTVPLIMLCTFGMFIPAMIGGNVVLATRNEMGIHGAVKTVTFIYLAFLSVLQDRTARRRFEDSIRLDLALLKTVDVRQELDEILEIIFPDKQVLDRIVTRKSVVDSSEYMAVGLLEVRDFLKWTTTMLPADTINIVGFLYGTYDRWADTFGLDYVKAVGDRYLAVSGLRSSSSSSGKGSSSSSSKPRSPAECVRAILKFALRQQKVIQDVNGRVSSVLEPIDSAVVVHVGPGLGMMMGSQYVLSYEMVGPAIVLARQLLMSIPAGRVTASSDAVIIATQQSTQLLLGNSTSASYNPYRKGSNSTGVLTTAQMPITFPASARPAGSAVTIQRRHNNSTTFVNEQDGVMVAPTTTATAAGDTSVAFGGSHQFPNFNFSRASGGDGGDGGGGVGATVADNQISMSLKASHRSNSLTNNSDAVSISLDDKEFVFTLLPQPLELCSDGQVVRKVTAVDVQSRRQNDSHPQQQQQQASLSAMGSLRSPKHQSMANKIDEPASAVRILGESTSAPSGTPKPAHSYDDDEEDALLSDRGSTCVSPNTTSAAVTAIATMQTNTPVTSTTARRTIPRHHLQTNPFIAKDVGQRLDTTAFPQHLKQFHAMGRESPSEHQPHGEDAFGTNSKRKSVQASAADGAWSDDDDDIFTGLPPPMSVAIAPADDIDMALAQPNRCLQDAMHAALVEVPQQTAATKSTEDGAAEVSALQNQRLRYVSIIKMVRMRREQHYEKTATLGTAVGSTGRREMLITSEAQQQESIKSLVRCLRSGTQHSATSAAPGSMSPAANGEQTLYAPNLFGSSALVDANPLVAGNSTPRNQNNLPSMDADEANAAPGNNGGRTFSPVNNFADWHGNSGEVGNVAQLRGGGTNENATSPTLTASSDASGRLPQSPVDDRAHPLNDITAAGGGRGRQRHASIVTNDSSNGPLANSTNAASTASSAVPFGREGFELFLKQLRPDIAREIEAEEIKRAEMGDVEMREQQSHHDDAESLGNSQLNPIGATTTPYVKKSSAPSVSILSTPHASTNPPNNFSLAGAGNSSMSATTPRPTAMVTTVVTATNRNNNNNPLAMQRKQQQQKESIASQMQSYISLLDVIRRGLPPLPPTLAELRVILEQQLLETPSPMAIRVRYLIGRVKYFFLYPTIIRRVIVPFESPIITAAYRRFHIRHSWRWKQVAYFVHAVFLTILILLIGADLAYVNIRLPNDTLAPTTASWGEYARSRGFPLLVVAIGVSWVRFLFGLKKWSFAKPPAPTLVGCCIGADTTPIEIDKYTFHLVQEVAGIDRRTAAAAKAMVHSASDDDDDDDDKKDENGNPLGVEDIMTTGIKFPKWYIADLGVLAVTMFMGHLSLAMMPIGIITNEAIFLVLHHTVIVYLVTTCYMHMIVLCTVNVLTFLFSHFVIYVVALGGHVGSTRLLLVVLYLVGGMLMAWARELKQVYHFELLALHRAVLQATKEELVLQRHLFSVLLPACMRDGKSVTQIAAHRRTMAEHAHGISGVPLLPPVRIHYSDLCTIAIRLDPRVFAGIMTSPATFVAKMDSILNAIECVVYQANALILARRRHAHSHHSVDGMTSSSSSDDDDNNESEKGSGGGKKWLAGGGSSVTREELISRIHVKGDIILFAGPMVRESAPSNNNNKPKRRHEEGEDDNDAEDELPPVVNTAAERLVGRALEVMLLISKTFMEADQFSLSQETSQHPKPAPLTATGSNKGQVSTTLGESGGGGDVSSFTSSGGISAGLYGTSQKQSGEPRMLFPVSLMNSTDPQRSNSPSSGGRGGGVGTHLVSPTSSTAPHQPHLRLTSVVCLGSGFVTMLGSRGLTPSLMGSVARQTSALILAAPTGFHGCSSHFLNSLSVYGVAAPKAVSSGNVGEKSATVSSISDIVDCSNVRDAANNVSGNTATPHTTATGVVSLPLQKWRIRGSGVMLVHPLGLAEKDK